MSEWTTTCDRCEEEIVVDDPNSIPKLDGEPYHDDCIERIWQDLEHDDVLDFPMEFSVEVRNDVEGYVPHHVEKAYEPFDVVIGSVDTDDHTTVSSTRVPNEFWRLGHMTQVRFRIEEGWNIYPIAVDGKEVKHES